MLEPQHARERHPENTNQLREVVQDVYKSWQLPERAPRVPPPPHVTQPFDATSAYQENYPAHELQPRWRRQPETWNGRNPPPVSPMY